MRANIYIDGFNLYYGALRETPYKWLDLEALSRILVPSHEINRIRYFTARITTRVDDADAPTRQNFYLRALQANPKVYLHLGRFKETRVRMALAKPQPGQQRTVEVLKSEEKGTDVNIATYLLLDAFRGDCDLSVVVSNDADLAEPIRVLLAELGKPVGIVNPWVGGRHCQDLANLRATFYKTIRNGALRRAQLPTVVLSGTTPFSRPRQW
jgi:uncharacterized LabA/DUF88 family protein